MHIDKNNCKSDCLKSYFWEVYKYKICDICFQEDQSFADYFQDFVYYQKLWVLDRVTERQITILQPKEQKARGNDANKVSENRYSER